VIRPPCGVRSAGLAALTAVFVVFVAASPAPASAANNATTPTAQSEYQAALKATAGKTVHFVSSASENGVTIHVTGDAGPNSGTQSLTVSKGNTTERVKAKTIGSIGFVEGNSTALHNVLGLTAAQSRTYAGKWLSFPSSNSAFDDLLGGLLSAEIPEELQLGGTLRYDAATTFNGQAARVVRGQVSTETGQKVPQVLYVAVHGTPLPLAEVTNPGASKASSIHGELVFTHWGERLTVHAPPHAVSLLTLAPTATSGATSTTSTSTPGG
jgi:hypothetical protein